MVTLFAVAIVGAMYVTGGIGDGVGLFRDTGSEAESASAGPSASATPEDLFDDDDDSDAEVAIEAAVRAGAMSACGGEAERTFCPGDPITRAEFALALDSALAPPEAEGAFSDVPPDAPYAGAVARLAANGVISGCGEDQFCPDDPVTRAQAAALVARTLDLPAEPIESFDDVPAGSTFEKSIGRMAAQGIMRECSEAPPQFCPGDPLDRSTAAVLLVESGLLG